MDWILLLFGWFGIIIFSLFIVTVIIYLYIFNLGIFKEGCFWKATAKTKLFITFGTVVIFICVALGASQSLIFKKAPEQITLSKAENQSRTNSENKQPKDSDAKQDVAKEKPAVTSSQMKELQEAFNTLESNNKFSILYDGVRSEIKANGGQRVIVYVNDNWNGISKDIKIAFVKHVAGVWAGMNGARGIAFDNNLFDIQIKHSQSERTVATWGSFLGPSIKD